MSSKPDPRPMSPYMLGPYYKFQITSLLSISGRLTGLFLSLVTLPAAIVWLLALAAGPGAHTTAQGLLGSLVGKLFLAISLLCLNFHLLNGLRHLTWDTGRGFAMSTVRASGWAVIVGTVVLSALIWWAAA